MITCMAVLVVMTAMGSVASLFLKRASGAYGVMTLLKDYNLYLGAILYICAAGLNIWILRYLDYSVVLPLTSLTYVWTMFLSHRFLGEKITSRKILGVTLIFFGAILVSFVR